MIKEIYIFGTTVGFDISPVDNSTPYYECFYDGSIVDKKFIISQSGNIVRYNYLRYNNILGAGGRENSFFGLCLVLEGEYINKPYRLFQLFETVFNRMVQSGVVLVYNNGKYKYKGSFKDLAQEVEGVKNTLRKLVQTQFAEDIETLTSNLNVAYHNKVTYYNYNKNDLDDSKINNSFLQNGRIEFNNEEGTIEVISIEQFSDFKKESKKYSDFRKEFADKTSSFQNDWITNKKINKKTIENEITQSISILEKIKSVVDILQKNNNLKYVNELNAKYVENFNSINDNRTKLKNLLDVKDSVSSSKKSQQPISNSANESEQLPTSNYENLQSSSDAINHTPTEDIKLFPILSKYSKQILVTLAIIFVGLLGYYLYPKEIPPIEYGYSNNHTVDSMINQLHEYEKQNDSNSIISLMDYMKNNIGINKYELKPTYSIDELNNLRAKFTRVSSKQDTTISIPQANPDLPTVEGDTVASEVKTTGGKATGGRTAGGKTTGGRTAGGKTTGGKTTGGKATGGKTTVGKTTGGKATTTNKKQEPENKKSPSDFKPKN